jgi:hypothetical protein
VACRKDELGGGGDDSSGGGEGGGDEGGGGDSEGGEGSTLFASKWTSRVWYVRPCRDLPAAVVMAAAEIMDGSRNNNGWQQK